MADPETDANRRAASPTAWWFGAAVLGALGFSVVLAWHNTADNDLWARLAVGARLWHTGTLWPHDVFAFTPTLPVWIDHEWGAGAIFFAVLTAGGSAGLMVLKILLALTALGLALDTARRRGAAPPALLLAAIPCAWAILPGYVPVIRSHAFTYAAFALMLWLCERVAAGRRSWWPLIPLLLLAWVNIHGGFVTGFLPPAVYALVQGVPPWMRHLRRGHFKPNETNPCVSWPWLALAAGAAVTLVNPWGWRFLAYLVPALLHPRTRIDEWGPMPLWGWDAFTGYRVLTIVALVMIAALWRRQDAAHRRRLAPALVLLVLTAAAGWLHRRHAPFFGIAAAALLPALVARGRASLPTAKAVAVLFGGLTAGLLLRFLPDASLQVWAPVGIFPVRECDILSRAGIDGNVAVPFDWGSYAAWRLYPHLKISMDGRYEETFPEATLEANARFYEREGADWDRLVRENRVDFVIVNHRRTRLKPADLTALGFEPVYLQPLSSLWARPSTAARLRATADALPDSTIDPLDPAIPARWPWGR